MTNDYAMFRDLTTVAEKHGYRIERMGDAPKRWPMKGARARKAIILEAIK